jgi:hypothetical protein
MITERRASISLTVRKRIGDLIGPYSDLSAVFLQLSFTALKPGGYLGLCQPTSIVSTRDGAKIRDYLTSRGHLIQLLLDVDRSFDAAVNVCAPILQRAHESDLVSSDWRSNQHGRASGSSWSSALVDTLSLPRAPHNLHLNEGATLASLAVVAADFRDQYYWVTHEVLELEDLPNRLPYARVISSGLIGSGLHRWAIKTARIGGTRYQRPVIPVPPPGSHDRYHLWLQSRLRPKLLVATQTQTLEVVSDPNGSLVPLVPVLSLFPHNENDLYHLSALLLSPALTTIALSRHLGSGLSPKALKLSAQNLREFPLPKHQEAWDEAALLHRKSFSNGADLSPEHRRSLLIASAHLIDEAFGVKSTEECYKWWVGKLDL